MFLSQIRIGETVKVLALNNPEKIKRRLENMGLTRGAVITLIKKAPFGDPIEIKLRDFYLALRVVDATKIMVELVWTTL